MGVVETAVAMTVAANPLATVSRATVVIAHAASARSEIVRRVPATVHSATASLVMLVNAVIVHVVTVRLAIAQTVATVPLVQKDHMETVRLVLATVLMAVSRARMVIVHAATALTEQSRLAINRVKAVLPAASLLARVVSVASRVVSVPKVVFPARVQVKDSAVKVQVTRVRAMAVAVPVESHLVASLLAVGE